MLSDELELRGEFFKRIFSEHKGYICIATDSAVGGDFKQRFFQWPHDEELMLTFIDKNSDTNRNVWFGVNILKSKKREKQYCIESNLLWADLDECDPDKIEPHPQVVIQSSPGRFQAIWRLDKNIDPSIAEDYSKRLAYTVGADKSGWDLTQLLRVPYTHNAKYEDRPKIMLLRALPDLLPVEVFDILSSKFATREQIEYDEQIPEAQVAEEIIRKHQNALLKNGFSQVWDYEPTESDDWSKLLWRLHMICLESGLTLEETYSIAFHSSVNKFRRDDRPARYLWQEVQKAYDKIFGLEILLGGSVFDMPELIPGESYKFDLPFFVDDYVSWGKEATDARPQFHELSSFVLLSALLSANLQLPTSWGTIKPNLWGLIMGQSTLDRKTTSMNMARDIIDYVDRDILIATDGSSEGILTGISGRPGRTSMYYRDEVVGLFHEMSNKQYLAGLPQMFTQLYDGGFMARRLRKEVVTVTDPVFIFFGGGIKDQFFVAANEDLVYSGFLPRFLIVSGETNLSELRRLGPPTELITEKKQAIYERSRKLYNDYAVSQEVEILGQTAQIPGHVEVSISLEGWELFGEIQERLTENAFNSPKQGLALPTFERMATSLLKMAMLLAASRQIPDDGKIETSLDDLRKAAYYIQNWGHYTIEVILNLGQTASMRVIERVRKHIANNPGIARSRVMQAMNLTKRQMQEIEETLEARGEIRSVPVRGGKTYTAI